MLSMLLMYDITQQLCPYLCSYVICHDRMLSIPPGDKAVRCIGPDHNCNHVQNMDHICSISDQGSEAADTQVMHVMHMTEAQLVTKQCSHQLHMTQNGAGCPSACKSTVYTDNMITLQTSD